MVSGAQGAAADFAANVAQTGEETAAKLTETAEKGIEAMSLIPPAVEAELAQALADTGAAGRGTGRQVHRQRGPREGGRCPHR